MQIFGKILALGDGETIGIPLPEFTKEVAARLIDRIENVQLYAHSCSFNLNFVRGVFTTIDLIDFARDHGLVGINIHPYHINLGDKESKNLDHINAYARNAGVKINLEISSTIPKQVLNVVKWGQSLGTKNIRVFIRHQGRLNEIVEQTIEDLKHTANIAERYDFDFYLEQHGRLKSHELMEIVEAVDSKRIHLLFDFANSITANEDPLHALQVMSPRVRMLHLKGAKRIKRYDGRGVGYEQVGMPQGKDELPQLKLLFDCLMLGEEEAQVKCFALEQEVGHWSRPFRFEDEPENPRIPYMTGETLRDYIYPLKKNLRREKHDAHNQVQFVMKELTRLKTLAEIMLNT